MSIGLPQLPNKDGIRKNRTVTFGGYNHTLGAGDGDLWDMQNLTSDHYPVLASRGPRYRIGTLEKPNGFYCHDGLFWVDGTDFYADGVLVGTVSDSAKRFASLGAYIVILPDMKYYNRLSGVFGSMGASWSGAASFLNGTYAGEPAEGNTIYSADADWASVFSVGDAVTISGAFMHPENNQTLVIREIDGNFLRFYENSFTVDTSFIYAEDLTIAREIPALEFICENENRLWGCKGDTIYASKLGDIFNWNVFDGLATDSYAVDVGSAGDFTGCCSYLGYACFFKEENIYKVYGDKPSNFQVMGSASLGTAAGSGDSFAIAGETLFYLARTGIVAYAGGVPQSVAEGFGKARYRNAVGGSDGVKYYVSMEDASGDWHLFVYDTRKGLWHREDDKQIVAFGWNGELYFLDSEGNLWLGGNPREIPDDAEEETDIESVAEFADFTTYNRDYAQYGANKKGTGKLQIRMELEAGSRVRIEMQFDSDGIWREVKTLSTESVKRSFYLPIIPRRSDHFRIRFTGHGQWRLYSLVSESYSGSEL